jgi:hypothetical protein
MFTCAPSTYGVIGAAKCVVAKVLAACTLGEEVETQTAFQVKGGRVGRQARSLSDVLCLGIGDGDDDGGGRFPFTTFIRCEPTGFLGED